MVGACYSKSQNQVGIQWNLSQLCLNCVLFLKCVKRQARLFCQLKNNHKIWPTSISDKEWKKSRLREKQSLSTNANRSTDSEKNTRIFCQELFKKIGRGYPRQRAKYLAGALALLFRKFWLVQKFLGCITYFFLTTTYLKGSLPFFLKCAEEFQINLGIVLYQKLSKCIILSYQ